MPLLSIIIPVYNVEQYVARCVNSILEQSFQDYEIIIVDDGSTDNSLYLCEELARNISKVECYHKKNEGVSSARNYGLLRARGEWITFIDADDALETECLKKIVPLFEENDVVRFSTACLWNEIGTERTNLVIKDIKKEGYLSSVLSRDTALGVCGGAYKCSLFKMNDITFDESLTSGEDWLVLVKLILSSNNLGIIEEPLYLYTKYNENSATSNYSFGKSVSMLIAQKKIESEFEQRGLKKQYKKSLSTGKAKILYYFAAQYMNSWGVTESELSEYWDMNPMSFEELLMSSVPFKVKAALLLYKSQAGLRFIKRLKVNKDEYSIFKE